VDATRALLIVEGGTCGSELGPASVDRSGLDRDRADVDRWIWIGPGRAKHRGGAG